MQHLNSQFTLQVAKSLQSTISTLGPKSIISSETTTSPGMISMLKKTKAPHEIHGGLLFYPWDPWDPYIQII